MRREEVEVVPTKISIIFDLVYSGCLSALYRKVNTYICNNFILIHHG